MPSVSGVALRSMKDPGTAYNDPQLGQDPQPANMANYLDTTDDNGGVHINSGIPNHAFFLTATKMPGKRQAAFGVWRSPLDCRPIPISKLLLTLRSRSPASCMAPAAPSSKLCRVVGTKWELPSILLLPKSWPDRQRSRLKNANYSNTQDLTSAGPFFLERTFVQTHRIFVPFALEKQICRFTWSGAGDLRDCD